jgi:5-hydroxyisourate hydrolase
MGRLSTHVLDTANGKPAGGVAVTLSRLEDDGSRTILVETRTNADGRTDAPLLTGDAFACGRYELVFAIGDYFRAGGLNLPEPAFLDEVPIRFGIAEPNGHYHVPLLASPWGCTTYRGS